MPRISAESSNDAIRKAYQKGATLISLMDLTGFTYSRIQEILQGDGTEERPDIRRTGGWHRKR